MKKENTTGSEVIKEFLDFTETVRQKYEYCFSAMKNEEAITQDYLHSLELDELCYRERSRVAARLVANRKARRRFKDEVEELEPIMTFLEDPKNVSFLHALSQLLGQVRKVENYHKSRFYIPKVITNPKENLEESAS